jgi:hypothetical protein
VSYTLNCKGLRYPTRRTPWEFHPSSWFLVLVCITLLSLLGPASTEGQPGCNVAGSGLKFQSATFGLYLDRTPNLSAVIGIERSYADYQRRGFFRVGLLPVVVLEGVTITIQDYGSVSNSLANLGRWASDRQSHRIELRRVSIQWAKDPSRRLEIGRVQCRQPGEWWLAGGVRWAANGRIQVSPQATLKVAGDQIGDLVFSEQSEMVRNLFEPPRPATPDGGNL